MMTELPPLWPHQAEAVAHTLHHWGEGGGAALFAGVGSGKSRVALEAARGLDRVLIICSQKIATNVWLDDQIPRWAPERRRVPIHLGPVKKRAATLAAAADSTPMVAVCNYEACFRSPLAELLLKIPWDAMVVDESHRIQKPTGRISRFCASLARRIPRRLIMTGTPISSAAGPLAIWGQYRACDASVLERTFTQFRARYSTPVPWGEPYQFMLVQRGSRQPQPWAYRNLEDLTARMGTIAYQVDTRNVFDNLPEVVDVERSVTLEPDAMRIYRALERDFIAEIAEGATVTASNALVKIRRLMQVCGGSTRLDTGEMAQVSTAKRDELEEFLTDIDEPVVVWAVHHTELDSVHAVAEKLQRPSFELSGRRDQLQAWNTESDSRGVLVAQPQAGSEGVSLVKARIGVFFSLSHSLAQLDQAKGRLVRPGQLRTPVVFVSLTASGTVDVAIRRALLARRSVVETILEWLRKDGQYKQPPDPDSQA